MPIREIPAPTRDELIAEWTPYVYAICHRFAASNILMDDLHQEALLGLTLALEGYNPARGGLKAYLGKCVNSHLVEMRAQMRAVKVPTYLNRVAARLRRAREVLAAAGELDPSIETLARLTKIKPQWVEWALDLDLDWNRLPVGPDHFATPPASDGMSRAELLELIESGLDSLPPADRDLITRLFGLGGAPQASCAELGAELGITCSTVHNRLRSALRRLLRAYRSRGITADSIALALA